MIVSRMLNSEILLKLLTDVRFVSYEKATMRLYVSDDKGGKVFLPDPSFGITEAAKDLVTSIPTPPFDLFNEPSVRRSTELEGMYISSIIVGIMEGPFESSFMDVLESYDFNNFTSESGTFFQKQRRNEKEFINGRILEEFISPSHFSSRSKVIFRILSSFHRSPLDSNPVYFPFPSNSLFKSSFPSG